MHLENGTCRDVVIPVGLLVELGPVTCHWRVNFWDIVFTHDLHEIVDVWHKGFDSNVRFLYDLLRKLMRHKIIIKVECHIFLEKVNHVKS